MNTPTPDPRPLPDLVDHLYAAAEAALIDYQTEPYGDVRLNAARASAKAVTAALAVLDLPARDARIRAETLRWAAAQWDAKAEQAAELPATNIGQSWQQYQLTESLTGVAEWCRSQATAVENGAVLPAESAVEASAVPVEGWRQHALADKAYKALRESAVPVEGSGHPQPAPALPWPFEPDPVAEAHLRQTGIDPDAIAAILRDHIRDLTTPPRRPVLSLDTPEGATTNEH